jgi:hypothetical protein
MRARVAAGWIEPEPEPEEAEEEFAESEGFEAAEGEEGYAEGPQAPASDEDEQLEGATPEDAEVFGEELERTRDA